MTPSEYRAALDEYERFIDAQPGTPAYARCNELIEALEDYENGSCRDVVAGDVLCECDCGQLCPVDKPCGWLS
jgi:hypothetical protein